MQIFRNRVTIFFIVFTIITSILNFGHVMPVYAEKTPDVTLYVHGEKSQGGPIFNGVGDMMGERLWMPNMTKQGTLRIHNNYSNRIRVNNIGITMKLEQLRGKEYFNIESKTALYETFARNMKLTIKLGRLLVFNDTIYNQSFYEMLYQQGDEQFQGFNLPPLDTFIIGRGNDLDLEYTIHMDQNAGNELQGLKATVLFLINTHEKPIVSSDNNSSEIEYNIELKKEEDIVSDELFTDIKGHWAHACITTLIKHDIITGYPDRTIRPENYISRAEVATLIGKALDIPPDNQFFSGYIDYVPSWAKGYVISTSKEDIFNGYPGKRFKSNQNITRQEMAKVLMLAFELEPREIALIFEDNEDISDWALEHVKAGVENNIITGYPDNTFRPEEYITRAEAFTMICKLLKYHDHT